MDAILYPNIYIYKGKHRMNEKKERINKTSFFRENATKFLASRYFRKGGALFDYGGLAQLGNLGYPTLSYSILFYPILIRSV